MKDFFKKYGSRKFLLAAFTNVLSVATILSGYGGKIGLIASIVAIIVTTAIYIMNETKIDVEAVGKIVQLSINDYVTIKKLIEEYEKQQQEEKEQVNMEIDEEKIE